jgi:hypothetical protein
MTTPHLCTNCEQPLAGMFCAACGQKRFEEKDKKLSHFLHDSVHFLTHFEGNFLLTLKTTFTRPAQFAIDYCAGKQKRYFKPISFFLFTVIIYLLFSNYQGLNMQFRTYVEPQNNMRYFSVPPARQKLKATGMTAEQLAEKFDARSPKFAKVLLLLLIPLSALALFILYYKQRPYFYDHFILATEMTAMYVLVFFVLASFVTTAWFQIHPVSARWYRGLAWSNYSTAVLFLLYVIVCLYRFYRQSIGITLFKAFLFSLFFGSVVHETYRIVLYYSVLFFI